jgi:hypothetical protein
MTKKLDTNAIVNELEGSAFFPSKKSSPTPLPDSKEADLTPDSKPVPPVRGTGRTPSTPVRVVPPVPPKRVMKQRWPVDVYQDQYESLKQLAEEERRQGGIGSMSRMVREAIDKLIADRRK